MKGRKNKRKEKEKKRNEIVKGKKRKTESVVNGKCVGKKEKCGRKEIMSSLELYIIQEDFFTNN